MSVHRRLHLLMNKWLVETVFNISSRNRSQVALFATLLCVLSSSPIIAADWDSVDELLTAVVGIHATVPAQARTAGSLGRERAGSGVLIDSNGLIVTIGYLILEAEQVEIVLPGGELVPVKLLAYEVYRRDRARWQCRSADKARTLASYLLTFRPPDQNVATCNGL